VKEEQALTKAYEHVLRTTKDDLLTKQNVIASMYHYIVHVIPEIHLTTIQIRDFLDERNSPLKQEVNN